MSARLTLEDAQEVARSRGGQCLSVQYVNNHTNMEWRCSKGHEWKAVFKEVKGGTWCLSCAGTRKLTLKDAQDVARDRGGECLSVVYTNLKTKMTWRCLEGHEWKAALNNVRNQGQWCPACAGRPILTIEDAHELARSRGGKCLTTVYKNKDSRLRWECVNGHQWSASMGSVRNSGTWCQTCSMKDAGLRKRDNIENMQELAQSKEGKCLSLEYTSCMCPLLWECKFGHQWKAVPNMVKNNGTWCPTCSRKQGGLKRRDTIENIRILAQSRGGLCLSPEYRGDTFKLLWQCENMHQWETPPGYIKQGNWCPNCRFKNEAECRNICERLTGKKFPKKRPDWLEGKELDGFCEEESIAFEHQGRQHYEVVDAWHRNGEADLESQQERDAVKAALCEDHEVALIVIDFDVGDKLKFIGDSLLVIYRKRREQLRAAWMARKASPRDFKIADDDRIWKGLGL
jgi:hypothetical protein